LLNLILPNGTFEPSTIKLFEEAGLPVVRRNSRSYSAAIDDPRIAKVKFLRPAEIPGAVEKGQFDIGLCGAHSVREARATVVEVLDLGPTGRAGGVPRIVLAVAGNLGIQSAGELPNGVRVSTEFPNLADDYFSGKGIKAQISFSHGATEAKVPEIADAIVELTETGSTLQEAGLVILDTLSPCSLKLIANDVAWTDPEKSSAIGEIAMLLGSVLDARERVLLKMNVPSGKLDEVIARLPPTTSPTVLCVFDSTFYRVETVVQRSCLNVLIPDLKKRGAADLIELPISKTLR
jgi:ATP phosphoribosyltransferase